MILFFTIALKGIHFTDMIKKIGLSLLRLETVMVIVKITDIDKSEGLSGQILLLGRKTECTGLIGRKRKERDRDRETERQ